VNHPEKIVKDVPEIAGVVRLFVGIGVAQGVKIVPLVLLTVALVRFVVIWHVTAQRIVVVVRGIAGAVYHSHPVGMASV